MDQPKVIELEKFEPIGSIFNDQANPKNSDWVGGLALYIYIYSFSKKLETIFQNLFVLLICLDSLEFKNNKEFGKKIGEGRN